MMALPKLEGLSKLDQITVSTAGSRIKVGHVLSTLIEVSTGSGVTFRIGLLYRRGFTNCFDLFSQ